MTHISILHLIESYNETGIRSAILSAWGFHLGEKKIFTTLLNSIVSYPKSIIYHTLTPIGVCTYKHVSTESKDTTQNKNK